VQITTIDVGNRAANVIPAKIEAGFNIRFNDLHSGASIENALRAALDAESERLGVRYGLEITVSGESFLTPPGPLSGIIEDAAHGVTGLRPALSTTGGTSDARFIKNFCPVAEFGLLNATAHKVDEHAAIADIRTLAEIYEAVLDNFFAP